MKAKYAIYIILVGFLINLIGSWLKITHISFGPITGNLSITFGTFILMVGVLLLIFKVLNYHKFKDFLNK